MFTNLPNKLERQYSLNKHKQTHIQHTLPITNSNTKQCDYWLRIVAYIYFFFYVNMFYNELLHVKEEEKRTQTQVNFKKRVRDNINDFIK